MKKLGFLFAMLFAFLLAGCSPAEVLTPTVATFTTEPPATEETFPELEWISQEQAMLEGYVVIQYGDVRHNQKAWMDFLDACDRGEAGSVQLVRYWNDGTHTMYTVSFDGSEFTALIRIGNVGTTLRFTDYLWESGELGKEDEPYDRYLRCSLTGDTDVILYEDLIAEPDYADITQIDLYLEGDPVLQNCQGEQCNRLLTLLTGAEYMTCPPEEYLLDAKLMLRKGEREPLVLEMDLYRGFFRFGEQYYRYAETSAPLLEALDLTDWPKAKCAVVE